MTNCIHFIDGHWKSCVLANTSTSTIDGPPCEACRRTWVDGQPPKEANEPIKEWVQLITGDPIIERPAEVELIDVELRLADPCIHRSDEPIDRANCNCPHKHTWACHSKARGIPTCKIIDCLSCSHYE